MINRNFKVRLKIHALLLSITLLSGCALRRSRKVYITSPSLTGKPLKITQQKPSKQQLTIFIHGTSQTINSMRFIPFLYNFVAIHGRTPEGMHHYNELPAHTGMIKCAEELYDNAPMRFPLDHCYFFGWSGKLNPRERKKAAYELYAAIKTLQTDAALRDAEITIITHSHGGNVALNLGDICKENNDANMSVNRLILLACPIQDETEEYAASPIFQTIYNLYSVKDLLQVADPQGLKHQHIKKTKTVFSRREIALENAGINIKQAAISINGYALSHVDFILPFFHKQLPYILELLDDETMCQKLPSINERSHQINLLTRRSCRYYHALRRIIEL